jgi:release factor glutamine methyltransferase
VDESWTVLKVLAWTAERFAARGIDSARLEAQLLLAHALSCSRVELYTGYDKPLAEEERAAFRTLVRRRLAGEPLAYLTGEQEFWSLPFHVDARVLIPRRDTETLVEVVLAAVGDRDRPLRIAEVATGSGAIAVTLARELAAAALVASDLSEGALAVARRNAARHRVDGRIEFRHGDLLAPLAREQFDVLVANLPYVPAGDIARLAAEVRAEPRLALDGGDSGLDLLRRLIDGVHPRLVPGGFLALEHGFDQGPAVRELLLDAGGFADVTTRDDLAGRPRVTSARRG